MSEWRAAGLGAASLGMVGWVSGLRRSQHSSGQTQCCPERKGCSQSSRTHTPDLKRHMELAGPSGFATARGTGMRQPHPARFCRWAPGIQDGMGRSTGPSDSTPPAPSSS